MCLYGFITGGEYPIIPEYAPEFTGTVFGFTNTLASSMGFLAPLIVGQILDSNKEEHVNYILMQASLTSKILRGILIEGVFWICG